MDETQDTQKQGEVDEVIGLAWDDHVTFESIHRQTGYTEPQVIALMRRELKPSSFRMWRERVSGRKSYKHSMHDSRVP